MGPPVAVALIPSMEDVFQGWRAGPPSMSHPADSSSLPRMTMGPSCLVPASPTSSGLPVPSSPFDCPHLFAHGAQRVFPGPGPSHSLRSTNLHLWLFVSMFYPIDASKDLKDHRVHIPCSAQRGKLRHREGKGQVGGRIGPSPVLFSSPCWLILLPPEALAHAAVDAGVG